MNLENRPFNSLIVEFANLRAATVDMFSGFTREMGLRKGVASGVEFTVEELGKILVGHEKHHRNVISERYLKEM